jgi:hypothetical protein
MKLVRFAVFVVIAIAWLRHCSRQKKESTC